MVISAEKFRWYGDVSDFLVIKDPGGGDLVQKDVPENGEDMKIHP